MKYLYEMHCHTSETSRCGKASAKEIVEYYKSLGFDGVCITDHFLNGNTTVPKDISYEERINLFFAGAEKAKEEGEKIGLKVFPCLEYSYFSGNDILTYGVTKELFIQHPEIISMPSVPYCNFIKENGGYVFHAHPFREASYIEMIRLFPRAVDGVEVVNACCTDFVNDRAKEYAANYELARICGSDNHRGPLPKISAVALPYPANSDIDIIKAVLKGDAELIENVLEM